MSLEASMLFGMLIGTTDSHVSLLTVMRIDSFGRGEWVLEFRGLEFPLDLIQGTDAVFWTLQQTHALHRQIHAHKKVNLQKMSAWQRIKVTVF